MVSRPLAVSWQTGLIPNDAVWCKRDKSTICEPSLLYDKLSLPVAHCGVSLALMGSMRSLCISEPSVSADELPSLIATCGVPACLFHVSCWYTQDQPISFLELYGYMYFLSQCFPYSFVCVNVYNVTIFLSLASYVYSYCNFLIWMPAFSPSSNVCLL